MSVRPQPLRAVYLLGFWILYARVTDARVRRRPPSLVHLSNPTDSGNRKQHGGLPTSGTQHALNGLREVDVNKLLPYEALEDTDVRERPLLHTETKINYHNPQNKSPNKNFTLLDRFSSGPSRSKRHIVVKFGDRSLSGESHVPRLLRFYKEVKTNFTNDKEELSKRFWNSMNTLTYPEISAGEHFREGMFSEIKANKQPGKEFPVTMAATPSKGYPWPLPQSLSTNPDHVFTIHGSAFRFILSRGSSDCDLIRAAFDRYRNHFLDRWRSLKSNEPSIGGRSNNSALLFRHQSSSGSVVQRLAVTIASPCDYYPSLESDESYHLFVENRTAVLRAPQVWGALRGLQSFVQLVYTCADAKMCINKTSIADFPRFRHRGIMLDTSRHFLSPSVIKKNMDVMEMNKLNVFHWHIVDDHSFPFVSREWPELSAKGAYSPRETYSHDVIKELIEYGRLRGIRLVPEFDTPGHVRSWGAGYPELLTDCGLEGKGPMDPTKNATFQFLGRLFSEVMNLFPDKMVHLGGDECSFDCWRNNQNIREFMQENGLGTEFGRLEDYYINRLLSILNGFEKNKEFVFWQDILDSNIRVPVDSIIHVWKGWGAEGIRALQRATELGLRTIYSAAWYLNYISYGKDWPKYYMVDPTDYVWDLEAKKLILGGEVCLWGEFIDDTNLLQTLWPRASAVAERLWSGRHVTSVSKAEPRLEEHRCRMIRADIPASPNSGPGSCHGPTTVADL